MDDAAIYRVSGTRAGLSVRLLAHSGSPRAFSPRDDKSGIVRCVCHCEERAKRGTRLSIVSRGSRTGCLFAY